MLHDLDRPADRHHVRDYGALGDGVADDSAAIQAAADAAGEAGTVVFGAGRYRVTQTLNQAKDQMWVGTGAMMGLDDPQHVIVSEVLDGPAILCVSAGLTNLRLRGPGAEHPGAVGVKILGAGLLRDVELWDFGVAIDMWQSWYTNISHVFCRFNALAVRVSYCYNVHFFDLRVHSMLRDNSHGDGLSLDDRTMVTFHGGSIEQYHHGVRLEKGTSASFVGTYFETYSPGAAGILVAGPDVTLSTSSCQVYLNNHQGWVQVQAGADGSVINSFGNKFKSSGTNAQGTAAAYFWDARDSHRMSVTLLGDSWNQVVGSGFVHTSGRSMVSGLLRPLRGGRSTRSLARGINAALGRVASLWRSR